MSHRQSPQTFYRVLTTEQPCTRRPQCSPDLTTRPPYITLALPEASGLGTNDSGFFRGRCRAQLTLRARHDPPQQRPKPHFSTAAASSPTTPPGDVLPAARLVQGRHAKRCIERLHRLLARRDFGAVSRRSRRSQPVAGGLRSAGADPEPASGPFCLVRQRSQLRMTGNKCQFTYSQVSATV